jgi:hypothetical protein
MFSFAPLPLYSRGKVTGTHLIRDWVGPKAGLGVLEKRKKFPPRPGMEPRYLGRSASSLVTVSTELSQLLNYIIRNFTIFTLYWLLFTKL